MYTLKIIRKFDTPTKIFDLVDFPVSLEEEFIELDSNAKVHYNYRDKNTDIIACVISGEFALYIHDTECAYLMNDQGQTVKIIHRV